MATTSQSDKSTTGIVIGIILVILIAAAVYFTTAKKDSGNAVSDPTAASEMVPAITPPVTTGSVATPSTANEEVRGTNAPINEVPAGTTDTMGISQTTTQ